MKHFLGIIFILVYGIGLGQSVERKLIKENTITELSVIISVDTLEEAEEIDLISFEELLKELGENIPVEFGINCENKKKEDSENVSNLKMSFKDKSSNPDQILTRLRKLKEIAIKYYSNK